MTGQDNIQGSGTEDQEKAAGTAGLWPKVFLAGFVVYLVLLTIGVVAEVFKIQSILDWWIWKPPGKP
ncbi:MAG: hypothetical protein OHK006_13380 [Thermodesulfovibrionales bacterium]